MLKFAVDQQRFCLLTGEQLLALWLKAEAEPRSRKALADSLLDCTGIYGGTACRRRVDALKDVEHRIVAIPQT
jgi:hypothetical protein